jgi:AcrR family transcriptional regulator
MAIFISSGGIDRPPGKRERRKRATLLALRVAAIDLSARRGFANVTVEDIAAAAGISARTFFNYFDSKETALVGGDPGFIESLRAGLTVLPRTMPPLAALRLVILARTRDMSEELAASPEHQAALLRRMAVVRAEPNCSPLTRGIWPRSNASCRQPWSRGWVATPGSNPTLPCWRPAAWRRYASRECAGAYPAARCQPTR